MTSQGPAWERRRVLVVDDERHIADTLALILQNHGYQTAVAYNGREAVKKARKFQPQLLLSDIRMPEMGGVETATAILGFLPRCLVLFISGHANTEEVKGHGLEFELCAKPIAPADLLNRIEKMFAAASL